MSKRQVEEENYVCMCVDPKPLNALNLNDYRNEFLMEVHFVFKIIITINTKAETVVKDKDNCYYIFKENSLL